MPGQFVFGEAVQSRFTGITVDLETLFGPNIEQNLQTIGSPGTIECSSGSQVTFTVQ